MLSHLASQDAKHIDAYTGKDAKSSKQHPMVCKDAIQDANKKDVKYDAKDAKQDAKDAQ